MSRTEHAVIRRYQSRPQGEIGYELAVLQALNTLGWSVPVPLADPIEFQGRIWCLFTWLPGVSPPATNTPADLQRRGQLLARLHADTQSLTGLGQRPGCAHAENIVADPRLTSRLRAYERLFPWQGRIMRWHQDRAHEHFDRLDLHARHLIVLHGDFTNRNLLYKRGHLSGIVDFEGTHLNHRASEFALAWRGKHDAVIHAYNDIHRLDEIDWALLTPTLWSWVFLGVADELERILTGIKPAHGFDWQIGMLLRRSPLMGSAQTPYPDNG